MSLARLRSLFFPAFLLAMATLAGSMLLESWLDLAPCPLCLSQRLLLGVYAVVCLVAVVHSPGVRGKRRYALLATGSAAAGTLLAGRHVWLQGELWGLPVAADVPVETTGQTLLRALQHLLIGTPDCISTSWSFLDLTLPEWSLMAFLLLAALPLCHVLAPRLRGTAGH